MLVGRLLPFGNVYSWGTIHGYVKLPDGSLNSSSISGIRQSDFLFGNPARWPWKSSKMPLASKCLGKNSSQIRFYQKNKNERFLNARFSTLQALQKDVRCADGKVFAGKRGWRCKVRLQHFNTSTHGRKWEGLYPTPKPTVAPKNRPSKQNMSFHVAKLC